MVLQHIYWIKTLFLVGFILGIGRSQIQAQNYPEFQIMRHEEDWKQQKNMPDKDFLDDILYHFENSNDMLYLGLRVGYKF